jgi:hypothetical protein
VRSGHVRATVTVTVRRTNPSGPARPSSRIAASSRRHSTAGPPQPPKSPHKPGTWPLRRRSARPPPASAAAGPDATAWHDTPQNRTPHRAALPASAVHHSPRTPALRSARRPRTHSQPRRQATQNRRYGTGTDAAVALDEAATEVSTAICWPPRRRVFRRGAVAGAGAVASGRMRVVVAMVLPR